MATDEDPYYFQASSITENIGRHFILLHSSERLYTYEPRTRVPGICQNDFRSNVYWRDERKDLSRAHIFYGWAWKFTGTVPLLWTVLKKTEQYLPQFLFRVISAKTKGRHTTAGFQSEARKRNPRADLALLNETDLKYQFSGHTRKRKHGTTGGWNFESHFISLTSSFLWALQRARSDMLSGCQNVSLCVIDTYKLREPAIIFKARELASAFEEKQSWQVTKAEAEFLAWDELVVDTCIVPVERLRPIWETLVPELNTTTKETGDPKKPPKLIPVKPSQYRKKQRDREEDRLWRNRALQVHGFFTHRANTSAGRLTHGKWTNTPFCKVDAIGLSDDDVRSAHRIAEAFDTDLRFPILIATLALRPRCHKAGDIIDALDIFFDGKFDTSGALYCGNDLEADFFVTNKDTPFIVELKTFQELLGKCCRHFGLRYLAGADRPSRKLEVDVEAAMFSLDPETDVYVDEIFIAAAARRARARGARKSANTTVQPIHAPKAAQPFQCSAELDEQNEDAHKVAPTILSETPQDLDDVDMPQNSIPEAGGACR